MRHSFNSTLLVAIWLPLYPPQTNLPLGVRKALTHNFPQVNKTETGVEPPKLLRGFRGLI
jgi:hypothetical protein